MSTSSFCFAFIFLISLNRNCVKTDKLTIKVGEREISEGGIQVGIHISRQKVQADPIAIGPENLPLKYINLIPTQRP